jgi:hypothetical protein
MIYEGEGGGEMRHKGLISKYAYIYLNLYMTCLVKIIDNIKASY